VTDELRISAPVTALLDWRYQRDEPRLAILAEAAASRPWSAHDDIDWRVEVPFGAPLPPDSQLGQEALAASPLARGGAALWDRFRWEHQAWLVSQFLHGEQAALVAAARLVEVLPDVGAKECAAGQVNDEARHVYVFSRYVRAHVPEPYPVSPSLARLLSDVIGARQWDLTALGMQMIIEPLALGAFRAADATLHDRLIRQIVHYVARDEARHISFGLTLLPPIVSQLGAAELAEREEFVMTALELMVQRSLLEEVWQRLGVRRADGVAFVRSSALMVAYRRTLFNKVLSALKRIGLLTERVRGAAERLALLEGPR
jgi:hypothetical protein